MNFDSEHGKSLARLIAARYGIKGALLFVDTTKPSPREAEWIRFIEASSSLHYVERPTRRQTLFALDAKNKLHQELAEVASCIKHLDQAQAQLFPQKKNNRQTDTGTLHFPLSVGLVETEQNNIQTFFFIKQQLRSTTNSRWLAAMQLHCRVQRRQQYQLK